MDSQLYVTFKRYDVLDTSKTILPFPCMELFSQFKCIKNHLRTFGNPLAVDESFSKVIILFLTHRWYYVGNPL